MPRQAVLPPTPATSTDIKGQDGTKLSSLQTSFELPPPAIVPPEASPPLSTPVDPKITPPSSNSTSTPPDSRPAYLQASETVKSRRRSSAAAAAAREQQQQLHQQQQQQHQHQHQPAKETFALPPPPTRSRKIIQMKPKPEEDQGHLMAAAGEAGGSGSSKAAVGSTAKNATASASGSGAATASSKKKQPSATSVAGRKIARKTAHSLIERRRRSKMNEEFAVLKSMVPACTGEMHKLAILQASIEYVRYLEDCVAKLKAQQGHGPSSPGLQTPSGHDQAYGSGRHQYQPHPEDHEGDVEMTGSETQSPTYSATHPRSHQSSISPALQAQDSRHRQDSYSSVSTDHRHYSYSASAGTSPAFGPQAYPAGGYPRGNTSAAPSTLTSPALLPQRDLDQEATMATTALMRLTTDRRGTGGSGGSGSSRGMSVADLLTPEVSR